MRFEAVKTGRDDVALLGFTSGTTGEPKATMHFHRDLLIIADGYATEILQRHARRVFVGSPPLAFTFGLGGLAIFPLRFGATATLLENASPANMIEIIETYKATISFTAPTAYRAMLAAMRQRCRSVVAARRRVGRRDVAGAGVQRVDGQDRQTHPRRHRLDGNAAHLHLQPRSTMRPRRRPASRSTGYQAKIVDDDMNEKPRGEVGRLAVRGPTGCRYLADKRQGDLCARRLEPDRRLLCPGRERLFPFCRPQRRHDHFGRLQHRRAGGGSGAAVPSRRQGMRGDRRAGRGARTNRAGSRGAARAVSSPASRPSSGCRIMSKATIAPYKYPRSVKFIDALPKTQTGKIQRFPPAAGCVHAGDGSMTQTPHEFLHPRGWKHAKGYANGIAAEGRMVFVAGQIGWNAEQEFDSPDFVAQTRQALENVVAVGGSRRQPRAHHPADLVHHRQDKNICRGCGARGGLPRRHGKALSGHDDGASRARWWRTRRKVEIEATAVVPH